MPDDVDLSAYIDTSGGGPDNSDSFEPTNPAWKEFVGEAPRDVYDSYLEPAFKKWDQSVNKRFQEYNQTYEPWKDFVKATDPETAGFAVNLLQAINNNPQEVISRLTEYYKLGNLNNDGQGQIEPKAVEPEDPYAARFANLERQNEIMAQALLQRHQQEEEIKASQWLDTELAKLQEANKHRGPFDEQYVCAVASATDNNLEKAVESYYAMADKIAGQTRFKPLIAGNGGGAPGGQKLNPRTMSNKDTNSLIVDILNATNATRQQ